MKKYQQKPKTTLSFNPATRAEPSPSATTPTTVSSNPATPASPPVLVTFSLAAAKGRKGFKTPNAVGAKKTAGSSVASAFGNGTSGDLAKEKVEYLTGVDEAGQLELRDRPVQVGPLVIPLPKSDDWRRRKRPKRKEEETAVAAAAKENGNSSGDGTAPTTAPSRLGGSDEPKKYGLIHLKPSVSKVSSPPASVDTTEESLPSSSPPPASIPAPTSAENDNVFISPPDDLDAEAARQLILDAEAAGSDAPSGTAADVRITLSVTASSRRTRRGRGDQNTATSTRQNNEDHETNSEAESGTSSSPPPEEATLDEYQSLSRDDFALALLRGMNWKEGEAIGRDRHKGAVVIPDIEGRPHQLGLGAPANYDFTL
ncbi:hypothetical protein H4R33_005848 [Dimargaris cristalligena]|nr:hypothetical protein H4R33_005848 [Dimargaris cristalligena]